MDVAARLVESFRSTAGTDDVAGSVEEAGADERTVALPTRLADDPQLRSTALRTLRPWT
ncbi:hypothetical protein [Saccharothrix deserti]|uniref:hypothetical protein n=1 Tax=Saccharothrix deserti TaxID=2593674 RepID=UPI00131E4013|nr:hypothetical protein [Saccharothrix deserti]